MADGDEIHANLPRRYLSIYQNVCASSFNAEAEAHDLAGVVRKDMKDFGNPPINYIEDCVRTLFSQLPEEPLLRQTVDYGQLQQQIDKISRQHFGNERGMDLARRSVRSSLEDYRQGGNRPNMQGVVEGYHMEIHEARFSERVPLTSSHLNGLSAAEVNARLSEIRPFAQKEYAHLSKSIARDPNVDRRIQRRRYNEGRGLYDKVR